jgi:hypothetical protein
MTGFLEIRLPSEGSKGEWIVFNNLPEKRKKEKSGDQRK